MNYSELGIMGAALYKCEGAKLRKDMRYPTGNTYFYSMEFTNSETVLIRLFLKFMRKVLHVDEKKLKCELFLYADQDLEKLHKYWEKQTQIEPGNFNKTIVFKAKSKFKPSRYGTCKLRYSSKEKYYELNQIITKRLGRQASLIK